MSDAFWEGPGFPAGAPVWVIVATFAAFVACFALSQWRRAPIDRARPLCELCKGRRVVHTTRGAFHCPYCARSGARYRFGLLWSALRALGFRV